MDQDMTLPGFWAVIPAGGAGSRLWPLSRSAAPKFLHDLTGSGRSLLQSTYDRLAPMCGEQLMVVSGDAHLASVSGQLPQVPADLLVTEPSPRGTMPAIGLAAALIEARDPDAVIGSFAADHVIRDVQGFQECVRQAVAAAREGLIVTIGIEPTFPSTGFGYIETGESLGLAEAPEARAVTRFVEKPDITTATAYLEDGGFRWNAGMFVVKARVLLDELARTDTGLAQGLRAIAADPTSLAEVWPTLTVCVIDRAVAEPAAARGQVAVVPGQFDWDDVGDFDSLAGLHPEAQDTVQALGEADLVVSERSSGLVLAHGGRTVAVVGVDDIVVIDTEDALLVTTRQHAQEVRAVVDRLRDLGRDDLL